MSGRLNIAIALAGRKGTGKSTYLNARATKYAKKTGKKVLIIDVNGAPAYRKHQLLSEAQFIHWCTKVNTGIKRFYLPENTEHMLELIVKYFRDGMIIFEDCTKYIEAQPSKTIKTFLVDHRMWNADLFFTFHALEFIPKFFLKMITYYQVMKTADILDNRDRELAKRFPNYYALKSAWMKVMADPSEYATKTVPTLI